MGYFPGNNVPRPVAAKKNFPGQKEEAKHKK